jgi:MFS family permease
MNVTELRTTRWAAVAAVAVAVVLASLDMTIVAVALPAIAANLAAAPAVIQWVMLAYFLPMVALSVPVGRWIDRVQTRAAFFLATVGFGVASVLVMVSPNLWMLLASRTIQGVFAAVIGVMGFPIVAASVRPEHRARAMSIILTLIPLAAVAGPPMGGLFTEHYGWRSVFAINIPVALVAAWLGHRSIPGTATPRAANPLQLPDRRLVGEAILLGGAVGTVLLGLDLLGRSPGSWTVPALLAAAGLVATVAWARTPASRSVVAFLRNPQLAMQITGMVFMTTIVGATYFLVPFFTSTVLHLSPSMGGLVLLALAAAMAATSPAAGVVADRMGPLPLLLAGAAATLAGVLGLALLDADPHAVDVAWRLALVGVGQGLFAGPNSAAILAATPRSMAGTAGGVTALFRTLGFSIGPALGALTWSVTGGGGVAFQTGTVTLVVLASGVVVAAVLALLFSRTRKASLHQDRDARS